MNYMGIDQHKQYLHLTLMDEEGKVLKAWAGDRPPLLTTAGNQACPKIEQYVRNKIRLIY